MRRTWHTAACFKQQTGQSKPAGPSSSSRHNSQRRLLQQLHIVPNRLLQVGELLVVGVVLVACRSRQHRGMPESAGAGRHCMRGPPAAAGRPERLRHLAPCSPTRRASPSFSFTICCSWGVLNVSMPQSAGQRGQGQMGDATSAGHNHNPAAAGPAGCRRPMQRLWCLAVSCHSCLPAPTGVVHHVDFSGAQQLLADGHRAQRVHSTAACGAKGMWQFCSGYDNKTGQQRVVGQARERESHQPHSMHKQMIKHTLTYRHCAQCGCRLLVGGEARERRLAVAVPGEHGQEAQHTRGQAAPAC